MSLKVLFSDPLLAQNIKKYEDSIPVPINNNIFSTYENFFEKNSKYLTMDGLLILLV